MNFRIKRELIKVDRAGGVTEIPIADLIGDGHDVIGTQFVTHPLNEKAIEIHLVMTVLDDEEKEARAQLDHTLAEDVMGGLLDEE